MIALTGHVAHTPVTVLAGSHLFSLSYSAAWNCCVTRGQRTTDLPFSCLTHVAAPGIESDLYASSSQYLKSESFFCLQLPKLWMHKSIFIFLGRVSHTGLISSSGWCSGEHLWCWYLKQSQLYARQVFKSLYYLPVSLHLLWNLIKLFGIESLGHTWWYTRVAVGFSLQSHFWYYNQGP